MYIGCKGGILTFSRFGFLIRDVTEPAKIFCRIPIFVSNSSGLDADVDLSRNHS